MKTVDKYIDLVKEIEFASEIPKLKNIPSITEKTYIIKKKKVKIDDDNSFFKDNEISRNTLAISAFVYTLSRYTGNFNVLFSLKENNIIVPFGKVIDEKKVVAFVNNVGKTLETIKKLGKDSFSLDNSVLLVIDNEKLLNDYMNNSEEDMKDIIFNLTIKSDSITFCVLYNKNVFDERLINNYIESYFIVLKSIQREENMLNIQYLTPSDMKFYKEVNNTKVSIDRSTVNKKFESQVLKNPDKLAVVSSNEKLTYTELNLLSNKVANKLIEKGIKSQDVVVLMLDRTVYSPVARQGVLKSGGAFLNIIPDYPIDRIEYILNDCNSNYIITTSKIKKKRKDVFGNIESNVITIEEILSYENDSDLSVDIKPDNLCYCIYTSGSTGKPKGVMISHQNLINYCDVNKYNQEAEIFTKDINASLALAALTFDVSILEEFIPLLNGGTLVIANEEEIYNPIKLANLVKKSKVEAIICTPSFINNIIDIDEIKKAFKNIKVFNIGAESFPPLLYSKLYNINKNAAICNGYGPTEATIGCTFKVLDNDENITIGVPMANVKIYMLDKKGLILPVGVPGELTITGDGVGKGYINRMDLTKEKFINIDGERAYRSGDLSRWSFDGEIDFIGRIDNQVKINGLRIELQEIESVINSYDNVSASIVNVIDNGKDKYLCAYVVATEEIDIIELKEYIQKYLTYYMVPKKIIVLESFPLNSNGKIDRKNLPIPSDNKDNVIKEPVTDLQKDLCKIMRKVLDNEIIGVNDNFFECGGNSLLVMKFITEASKRKIKIKYKDIFDYPTIEELEKCIQNKENNSNKKILDDIDTFNYSVINNTIKGNTLENIDIIKGTMIKNVVISGATGFLGMHILHEFLESYSGKVYCFIRKGNYETLEERINSLYKFYHNEDLSAYLGNRVFLIEGDITDIQTFKKLYDYNIDTFINCAALVKYFDAKDLIEKVNVGGVENVIKYCKDKNVRLIHISTTSIGGTKKEGYNLDNYKENVLYFGQGLENKYARTKFLAERLIIKAIKEGLNAKIMRIGNLMPRYTDKKFQINILDNGFLSIFRAIKYLKVVPISLLDQMVELSPIDCISKTVLLLSNTNEKYNVFHPFNNNSIHYYDIIHAMQDYGFEIKVVSDEVFNARLNSMFNEDKNSEILIGLFADLTASANERVLEIDANNTFTTEILYRLGYRWKEITNDYLLGVIEELDKNNYFK